MLLGVILGIIFGGLIGYCLAFSEAKSYIEELDKTGGF
jgi:hypothetical protein